MNRPTRVLALAAAALAAGALLTGCGSSTADSQAPQTSSAQAAVDAASDADVAFAQLMIPHHAQAVEMADLALQQGTSSDVLALAEQIKAAQDPEIQQMRGWLAAWGAPEEMDGGDHSDMDMGGMSVSGMMTDDDMSALMNAAGEEFDRMWLQMMIAHHQGAIQMAEQVLADSTNPDVTALANAVVSGQTAEIDTMQKLLAN